MPRPKAFPRPVCRAIQQRITILPGTGRKLSEMARLLGLRYNPTGRLLDLLVDAMMAAAGSVKPGPRKGYGRLSVEQVRSIRRSKEKIESIAAENGISHPMVEKIRAGTAYRWVTVR